jgi:hypothetical protein
MKAPTTQSATSIEAIAPHFAARRGLRLVPAESLTIRRDDDRA